MYSYMWEGFPHLYKMLWEKPNFLFSCAQLSSGCASRPLNHLPLTRICCAILIAASCSTIGIKTSSQPWTWCSGHAEPVKPLASSGSLTISWVYNLFFSPCLNLTCNGHLKEHIVLILNLSLKLTKSNLPAAIRQLPEPCPDFQTNKLQKDVNLIHANQATSF